jgi:hypothetical protein
MGRHSYSTTEKVVLEKVITIAVYPNPAAEILNIIGLNNNSKIEIIDMMGKVVLSATYNNTPISIGTLAAGQYQIKCTDGRYTRATRFAKQ